MWTGLQPRHLSADARARGKALNLRHLRDLPMWVQSWRGGALLRRSSLPRSVLATLGRERWFGLLRSVAGLQLGRFRNWQGTFKLRHRRLLRHQQVDLCYDVSRVGAILCFPIVADPV